MKRILLALLIVLLVVSCTQTSDRLNGKYKFANELRGLERRNWNAEFWTLEVTGDKGILLFTDAARGLYAFDLDVSIEQTEDKISVRFDAIARDAVMRTERLYKVQKGEKLLEIVQEENGFSVPFENITQLQYKELKKGIAKVERIDPGK